MVGTGDGETERARQRDAERERWNTERGRETHRESEK